MLNKKDFLKEKIEHIDIKKINSTQIIDSMRKMSFSSRDTANAADILNKMISDKDCSTWLTIAGSTSAAGCMQVYVDMVENNMVDVVVATGATIVDMDFFEALGFSHYRGNSNENDQVLREVYIDRIYDTYIDESELQKCDSVIKEIADSMSPGVYSSREFIQKMGQYLSKNSKKKNSLVETCFRKKVPIFCPAFSDSSAGFGLVMHQVEKGDGAISIDSVKDFKELTQLKISAGDTGLFMIGGGSPKNFAQDTVVCAEILGVDSPMHKYTVQITVADFRDGACSSSTLSEAHSWGKVTRTDEQMVYAEATTVLPIIVSYAYHKKQWKKRKNRKFSDELDTRDIKNLLQ